MKSPLVSIPTAVRRGSVWLGCAAALLAPLTTLAAPMMLINKAANGGPLTDSVLSGPPHRDAVAGAGIAIKPVSGAALSYYKYEFHDSRDTTAIRGTISKIDYVRVWETTGYVWYVVGFHIQASVKNDIPGSAYVQTIPSAANHQGEQRSATYERANQVMTEPCLAIEFAAASNGFGPRETSPFLTESTLPSDIIATNNTHVVFYNGSSLASAARGFIVPAWRFNNVSIGGTQTVTMSFKVRGRAGRQGTALYDALYWAKYFGSDVLSNPAADLKIEKYPMPFTANACSVFHK